MEIIKIPTRPPDNVINEDWDRWEATQKEKLGIDKNDYTYFFDGSYVDEYLFAWVNGHLYRAIKGRFNTGQIFERVYPDVFNENFAPAFICSCGNDELVSYIINSRLSLKCKKCNSSESVRWLD